MRFTANRVGEDLRIQLTRQWNRSRTITRDCAEVFLRGFSRENYFPRVNPVYGWRNLSAISKAGFQSGRWKRRARGDAAAFFTKRWKASLGTRRSERPNHLLTVNV